MCFLLDKQSLSRDGSTGSMEMFSVDSMQPMHPIPPLSLGLPSGKERWLMVINDD